MRQLWGGETGKRIFSRRAIIFTFSLFGLLKSRIFVSVNNVYAQISM